MNKGIIFDRDGTLIDFYRDVELGVVTPAFHPDHVVLLPGVVDGMRALAAAGYRLAIATNQPDAAKGRVPRAAIERTNAALVGRLADAGIAIDGLAVCLHHPQGGANGEPELIGPCACRKPLPGLLEQLIRELDLDRALSWMVGDTAADAGAARAASLRVGLILPEPRCELCPLRGAAPTGVDPEVRAPRLDELAALLLQSL